MQNPLIHLGVAKMGNCKWPIGDHDRFRFIRIMSYYLRGKKKLITWWLRRLAFMYRIEQCYDSPWGDRTRMCFKDYTELVYERRSRQKVNVMSNYTRSLNRQVSWFRMFVQPSRFANRVNFSWCSTNNSIFAEIPFTSRENGENSRPIECTVRTMV